MRNLLIATLVLGLGTVGIAQDRGGKEGKKQEDKTKKLKANKAVLKSVSEMLKLKGYHFSETASAAGQSGGSFNGTQKGDFCAATGSDEIYARKDKYLVSSGGKYVPPDQAGGGGQAGVSTAAIFRNPYLFLLDIKKLGKISIWNGEGTVDGVECRIAETTADEKTMMAQINEFASKSSQLKQYGITNVSSFIDKKESRSLYRVYIGKEDLKIYKIEWELEPKIKEGSIPGGFSPPTEDMSADYDLTFSKFDEDLEIDIPKEVKAKLKVR